jgi:toxin ParE1/3/4
MRRLKVTETAQDALLEVWSFIAQDNPSAADRLLAAIKNQLDRLVRFPELGRKRNELLQGLRSLVVKNYVIFYRLTDSYVEVVRVLHGPEIYSASLHNGDTSFLDVRYRYISVALRRSLRIHSPK